MNQQIGFSLAGGQAKESRLRAVNQSSRNSTISAKHFGLPKKSDQEFEIVNNYDMGHQLTICPKLYPYQLQILASNPNDRNEILDDLSFWRLDKQMKCLYSA